MGFLKIPIPVYYDTEAESQKLYERFLYSADLSTQQKDYLSQHKDVSDAVKNYLYINKYSNEAKEFVREIIDFSNEMGINAMEVLNNMQDYYKGMMSQEELDIFNGLNKITQVRYLGCAKKALDTAGELFPISLVPSNLHNGKGDAFRHAYWNGLSTYWIGKELTEKLTNAHENRPQIYTYEYKEVQMDLNNNFEGRRIAYYSNLSTLKDNILSQMNLGNLYYLNNLGSAPTFFATYNSQLIPTNR